MRKRLQEAGLTSREADIYLELVKLGSTSANIVAKRLNIDRTVVYNTLNKLIKKGLVSHITKEKKRFYQISDLKNLMRPLKAKEALLKSTIQELENIRKEVDELPSIQVYEGKEGLKSVYEIALKLKNSTFYSMGVTGKSLELLGYFFPNIAERLKNNQIKIKAIVNYEFRNGKFRKNNLVDSKYLSKEFSNKATTSIFGDYVAINLSEKPIIVLVKNRSMAEGYRNYFNLLWEQGKN
jgi:HTH-type transcriptional regulator, sugar sensing transcriptional regulator